MASRVMETVLQSSTTGQTSPGQPALPGARQGAGLGFVNTFRVGGTGPATGTGPRSAGLGCSGAGREQCGVPAASVPPHPSQPLHLARHPASPAALLRQPSGVAETGQGDPTSTHIDPHRCWKADRG